MGEMQPTPGPWQNDGTGMIYGQVTGEDDQAPFVADVRLNPNSYTHQEQANARLIEAAPALLELVKRIVGVRRWDLPVPVEIYQDAWQLITQATGQ